MLNYENIKLKSYYFFNFLSACDNHGQVSFIKVKNEEVRLPQIGRDVVGIRYFIYQHTKYVWISERQQFATLDLLIPLATVDEYLADVDGLSEDNYLNR